MKERNTPWPTGFTPPPAPSPTKVPASAILSAETPPEEAVGEFLSAFGATMDKGSVFIDKAGSAVAVSKALFIKGTDKEGGDFKWLAKADKADRLRYINLLAMTVLDPDEIWWAWEQGRDNPDLWILKRRYLKAFEVEGDEQYGVASFEWGKDGWSGSTIFTPQAAVPAHRGMYFDKQRAGRLIYRK